MAAYYNEIDPYAAQWLKNLIKDGLIADGEVDQRSIIDVTASDLRGFTQCHFFAGIGGWSHALRLAEWPDERPVWTGSCPCQPFSYAGNQRGFADERHLWPVFHSLIAQCRPPVVFGEQVASADGLAWLDAVYADLEATEYAVGAADLCAAGVGAPHIRQRLWFIAERMGDHGDEGLEGFRGGSPGEERRDGPQPAGPAAAASQPGGLADVDDAGRQLLADAGPTGLCRAPAGAAQRVQQSGPDGTGPRLAEPAGRPGPINGHWGAADWLFCRDAKWRPVEARVQQVVNGIPLRVGPLCPDLKYETEKILNAAAARLQTKADALLREVWRDVGPESVFGPGGRLLLVHEAQILLAYLLELAGPQGPEQDAEDGAGPPRGSQRDLRVLWRNREVGDTPRQRELARQQLAELADPLRLLSSAVARFAQEAGYQMLYADAPASFPIGPNLHSDQLGQVRSQNRAGRLRAYGNAIVPQVAAEVIRAFMDFSSCNPLHKAIDPSP